MKNKYIFFLFSFNTIEFSHGKYFCENIEFMAKNHNRQEIR